MDFFDHEKFMASLMDIFDEKNHIPFLPPKNKKPSTILSRMHVYMRVRVILKSQSTKNVSKVQSTWQFLSNFA